MGEALSLVAAAAREGLAARAAGPRRVPPGDAGAAAGRPAAVVPRLPEPPRAAGVLARARPAGGHGDAGEGDVGARRAALDAAGRGPRGAGAAVPAGVRAGDAHAARCVGADRCRRMRKSSSRECARSWRRLRSRGGRGSCSPRTWTGSTSPPAASGVRLLGGHDPYVAQPDRGIAGRAERRAEEAALPVGRAARGGAGGRRAGRPLARTQEGRRARGVRRVARRPGRRRGGGAGHRFVPRLQRGSRLVLNRLCAESAEGAGERRLVREGVRMEVGVSFGFDVAIPAASNDVLCPGRHFVRSASGGGRSRPNEMPAERGGSGGVGARAPAAWRGHVGAARGGWA